MDPVSFALSVASLAALYSNCVACFSAFKSCQSFERDHKILVTKLDVEKTILLQWGDRVGLISGRKRDLDPRLYEKRTNAAIAQVLRCIEMLLTDTDKLEKTYGLKPDRNGPSSARADMVSRHRMKNFERSHPEYESRVRYSRRDVNIVTKMRWAISDRNKFGSLVNEIRGFVSSLDRLIPTSQKIKLRLIEEDLNALGSSVQNLRLVEEATAFYHGDWSDAASDRATASEIASSAIGRSRSSPRRFGTEAEVAVDVNAWQERLVTEAVPACEQSSKPLRSRKTTDRQPECLSRERFTNIPPDSSSGDLSCSCKAIIAWKELLMRYDLSSKVQGLEARSYQPLSMRDFRNFAVDYYRLVTLYFELTNNILRWVIRVSELEECQMYTRNDSETTELETNDIAAMSYVISLISLNGFVEDYFGLLWDHIKYERLSTTFEEASNLEQGRERHRVLRSAYQLFESQGRESANYDVVGSSRRQCRADGLQGTHRNQGAKAAIMLFLRP
jgi:hypothetical protein